MLSLDILGVTDILSGILLTVTEFIYSDYTVINTSGGHNTLSVSYIAVTNKTNIALLY